MYTSRRRRGYKLAVGEGVAQPQYIAVRLQGWLRLVLWPQRVPITWPRPWCSRVVGCEMVAHSRRWSLSIASRWPSRWWWLGKQNPCEKISIFISNALSRVSRCIVPLVCSPVVRLRLYSLALLCQLQPRDHPKDNNKHVFCQEQAKEQNIYILRLCTGNKWFAKNKWFHSVKKNYSFFYF